MPHTTLAVSFVALAGLAVPAHAEPFTVLITADTGNASIGDTITWTISVTGVFAFTEYVNGYDLNLVASNPGVGTASAFADALQPVVGPTAGTPSGASIFGASGGQSSLLSGNTQVEGPLTLGTFTVITQAEGTLSYSLSDGDVLANVDVLRTNANNLGGIGDFNGMPTVVSDTVLVPAPAAWCVALAPLAFARRRR